MQSEAQNLSMMLETLINAVKFTRLGLVFSRKFLLSGFMTITERKNNTNFKIDFLKTKMLFEFNRYIDNSEKYQEG